MNDRKYSAKSKNDSAHTEFPLFQYNTSIIDLKLFPKEEQEDAQSYDYTNEIQPNYNFINSKKYLINKNIRFYQPIKDAEMLVQLESLRVKLQASNNSTNDLHRDFHNLNPTKTFNSHQSIPEHLDLTNCLHCKEEEQRKLQYMQLIQTEILRGKGSDTDNYSFKSYNLSSCTKKSPNQSPDIEFYNHLRPNDSETETIQPIQVSNREKTRTVFIQSADESDFPELKKYSKENLKANLSRIKSCYTNREKVSIQKPKTLLTNLLPMPEISSMTINLLKSKNVQKTVRKSTKSRLKNIYKQSDNSMEILEMRAKTPKSDYNSVNDAYLPPVVSYMDIHAPTLISFLDIRDTNSDNKSISSKIFLKQSPTKSDTNRKYQSTVIINDLIDFGTSNRKVRKGVNFPSNRISNKSKSNFSDFSINQKFQLKT